MQASSREADAGILLTGRGILQGRMRDSSEKLGFEIGRIAGLPSSKKRPVLCATGVLAVMHVVTAFSEDLVRRVVEVLTGQAPDKDFPDLVRVRAGILEFDAWPIVLRQVGRQ